VNLELRKNIGEISNDYWEVLSQEGLFFHQKEFWTFQESIGISVWMIVSINGGRLEAFLPMEVKSAAIFKYGLLPVEAWFADARVPGDEFYAQVFNLLEGKLMWLNAASNMGRFPNLNVGNVRKAIFGTYVMNLSKDFIKG